MEINIKWPSNGSETKYCIPTEELRAALDYAIRNNEELWQVVLDVAGKYQHERTMAAMKKLAKKTGNKRQS